MIKKKKKSTFGLSIIFLLQSINCSAENLLAYRGTLTKNHAGLKAVWMFIDTIFWGVICMLCYLLSFWPLALNVLHCTIWYKMALGVRKTNMHDSLLLSLFCRCF